MVNTGSRHVTPGARFISHGCKMLWAASRYKGVSSFWKVGGGGGGGGTLSEGAKRPSWSRGRGGREAAPPPTVGTFWIFAIENRHFNALCSRNQAKQQDGSAFHVFSNGFDPKSGGGDKWYDVPPTFKSGGDLSPLSPPVDALEPLARLLQATHTWPAPAVALPQRCGPDRTTARESRRS